LYYAAIFVSWVTCTLSRQYYYLFVSSFGLSVMCLTKLIYGDPRPYFVDADIEPLGECTADFANPSGHTLYIFLWSIMLYLDCMEAYSISWNNFKANLVLYLVIVPFCMLNGFSRLYVGVHGLNQIVFGGCLGIFCAFYSHFVVRKPLMQHVEDLLAASKSQKFTKETNLVIYCTLVHIVGTFVPYTIHEIIGVPDEWEANLCEDMNMNKAFGKRTLNDSMICYGATTAYFGLHLLKGRGISNSWDDSVHNVLTRLLALIVSLLVPVAIMFTYSSEGEYVPYLVIVNFLPWAGIGFCVYFVLPVLFFEVFDVSGNMAQRTKEVSMQDLSRHKQKLMIVFV